MSTYPDRPENQAGHGDEGLFYPNTSAGATYNASGHDPGAGSFGTGSDTGSFPDTGATTSVLPAGMSGTGMPGGFNTGTGTGVPSATSLGGVDPNRWHGSADLGMLVLRLVVGGTFGGLGLQHLFGLFDGIGRSGFQQFLASAGYEHVSILVWVAGGTEILAGALLILGLFTPLGAAGALALLANVIVLKWPLGFFEPGYELEMITAAAVFAILFVGPGRVSLDRPTPWYRRPGLNGFLFLIIGAAAAVAVLLLLRHHS